MAFFFLSLSPPLQNLQNKNVLFTCYSSPQILSSAGDLLPSIRLLTLVIKPKSEVGPMYLNKGKVSIDRWLLTYLP